MVIYGMNPRMEISLFIINDGSSSQWVSINSEGPVGPVGPQGSTGPSMSTSSKTSAYT